MKTRPQMTIVEPRIRIPVWRRASPKNWKTRPVKTRPATRAQKPKISPIDSSHPRGTASQPAFMIPPPSLDHLQLGVRGQQGLGEDVVEREHAHEGDDHSLVDGSA